MAASEAFRPGQVLTVFRSRLRDDAAAGYHDTAAEMLALARTMPGFIEHKSFTADDGERVSIVTFADHESQRAWREHADHRRAQEQGRRDWYAAYSLQVADVVAVSEHTFD